MDDTVFKLLDEIEEIIDGSHATPFSGKVKVDKDEIYAILSEIRTNLPKEIEQAKWVIEERNKILIDAQKEADEMLKNAEAHIEKLINEDEITKRAYEQAAVISENSKKMAKEMRLGAMEYADEVLSLAEQRVKDLMEAMKEESIKSEQFFNQTLNIIYENRQELRGVKK
ncbi:ATPase [Tyzzerella sp. An114]|uniref:ATPase n=1 Tax=Tyzzerella sp. An114 TaxID=1965545 RepID=UPI000B43AFA5|nr:ATPase [Tyzzerella sp. An114]OUQ58868.1 ATPase [Tyzzerella sp. An114]